MADRSEKKGKRFLLGSGRSTCMYMLSMILNKRKGGGVLLSRSLSCINLNWSFMGGQTLEMWSDMIGT